MKRVLIISGKGGTGKTTVSAALADIAAREMKLVIADADVDAANLELLLEPRQISSTPFTAGKTAVIDPGLCIACGRCMEVCRFGAVHADGQYAIDPQLCEGCLACLHQCPAGAIRTEVHQSGEWFRSTTPYGTLFHANLWPGEENSGKLVSELVGQAQAEGERTRAGLMLVDGPPGIGCPVTAACRSADLAMLVSEPTVSGRHDLERVLRLTRYFNLPAALVLNKATLNDKARAEMLDFAQSENMELIGEIPYDEGVMQALRQAKPLTRSASPAIQSALEAIWQQLKERIA